jgi:hypothetical protein
MKIGTPFANSFVSVGLLCRGKSDEVSFDDAQLAEEGQGGFGLVVRLADSCCWLGPASPEGPRGLIARKLDHDWERHSNRSSRNGFDRLIRSSPRACRSGSIRLLGSMTIPPAGCRSTPSPC